MLDRRGRLAHDGGVLPTPGAYVLGLPFLRRRKSSFLDGVGPDAEELTEHLLAHLDRTATRRPSPAPPSADEGRLLVGAAPLPRPLRRGSRPAGCGSEADRVGGVPRLLRV